MIDSSPLIGMLREMEVHERIRALRRFKGLSQEDLAKHAGVDRGTVSNWEAHPDHERAHQPGPDNRSRLAVAFGVPAYVLTPDFGPQNEAEKSGELVVPPKLVTPRQEKTEVPEPVTPPLPADSPLANVKPNRPDGPAEGVTRIG